MSSLGKGILLQQKTYVLENLRKCSSSPARDGNIWLCKIWRIENGDEFISGKYPNAHHGARGTRFPIAIEKMSYIYRFYQYIPNGPRYKTYKWSCTFHEKFVIKDGRRINMIIGWSRLSVDKTKAMVLFLKLLMQNN